MERRVRDNGHHKANDAERPQNRIQQIKGKTINSRIDDRVTIGEDSKIINSTVRGPCIIGRNCIIEDSYIGPYTSIGDNTRIIRSSIEFSIVLEKVTIEGIDRLEGSLIGENAKTNQIK